MAFRPPAAACGTQTDQPHGAAMKRLQRYVLINVGGALLAAFAALVLLMVLGLCMQLLHEGLDVVRLYALLPPIFAYCVPVVLPSAFLTAVILTFGRFSADNELIAVRAAGIPLSRIVYPVLVVGVVLSLVAAYFQFETVPRARASIKTLKYQVLKQMLLDRVALSWKRQFSFPPVHIQYDDYVNDRMTGVTVVEVRGGRPRTLITAASSTVDADAGREEAVVFVMNDCVLTRFDIEESGEARTLTSESKRAIYTVRVAPDVEEVLSHRKHLPLGPLLTKLRKLRAEVAEQTRYADPEAVADERKKEGRELNAQIAELERAIEAARDKLLKYAEQEPRRLAHLIERDEQLIFEIRAQVDLLRQQQAEVAGQLTEMQEGAADLERSVELRRRQAELLAQIGARGAELDRLREQVAASRRLASEAAARAAELSGKLAELERRWEELLARRRELNRVIGQADDQRELAAIRIRIHKRLAQAASVLIFALVGIPLGIMGSRRSVMIAFGISFAVVLLIFYPLLILGQMAAEAGRAPILPAMWAGNGLTLLIGLALTGRILTR